jgi:hypothetical protein
MFSIMVTPGSSAWGTATRAAMNLIKFLIAPGKRHLFNGKCQVIIQAGKTPGAIKFEAKSDSPLHSVHGYFYNITFNFPDKGK